MKYLIVTAITSAFLLANVKANVEAVNVVKNSDRYSFSVKLHSTETGCKQYANWWEVLNSKGELLYRRILFHSHPNDQPFIRSGGSIKLDKNETIYIRAHMNNVGYVGDIFVGTVVSGFKKAIKLPTFDNKKLESTKPLPDGCAF